MASLCSHLHNYEGRLVQISPGQYVKILSPASISCFLNLDSTPNQNFFLREVLNYSLTFLQPVRGSSASFLNLRTNGNYADVSSCSQTCSLNISLKARFSSFGSICWQFPCSPRIFNLKHLLNPYGSATVMVQTYPSISWGS